MSTSEEQSVTPADRVRLRRLADRGSYEKQTIHAILDAGFLAHVGFGLEGQPFVIPTLYARDGDRVYLHGSAASRMLRALDAGLPACITVSLVDGLVLARSAFHHSVNYRSVVAFGTARSIQDPAEKVTALRAISEHLIAGRWAEVRTPSEKELQATAVLDFVIEDAAAKVRTGPPNDDAQDCRLPVWAGVIPLQLKAAEPVADGPQSAPMPEYVRLYGRP